MRVYTHYSKPFEPLYRDFFRATLPASFECTPTVMPEKFNDVLCYRKDYGRWVSGYKRDIVRFERGNTIVIAGCDMLWNGDCVPDLLSQMETVDVTGMNDGGYRCYDFLVLRCTDEVIAVFDLVHMYVDAFRSDQVAFNAALNLTGVRRGILPHEKYWNVSKSLPKDRGKTYQGAASIPPPVEGLWTPDLGIPLPPKEMLVLHANYVDGGIANKTLLLEGVREHIREGRFQ